MARLIAIFAAVGGGVKGIMGGDLLGAIWAIGLSGLFYCLVVFGTNLILKGRRSG